MAAQWVIWGNYERRDNQWLVKIFVFGAERGISEELTVVSDDWNQIGKELNTQILRLLNIQPTDIEREKMEKRFANSPTAFMQMGVALLLQAAGRPIAESEAWLREAIKTDGRLAVAYVELASVLNNEQKTDEAKQTIRAVLSFDPDFADAHKMLGVFFMNEGNNEQAGTELERATRFNPDDAEAFGRLGDVYMRQFRIPEAVHVLDLSLKLDPHADFSPLVRTLLAEANAWLAPPYTKIAQPEVFTQAELVETIQRKIGPGDMKWTISPFATTPEMDNWARQLTEGVTNGEAKARILFKTLAQRAMKDWASQQRYAIRTASEVFADWNNPGVSFCCRDYTLLYVTLARAVGITAYVVNVEQEANGDKVPHACAALVLGENGLLSDLSLLQFGVAHKHFTIMNDLQVTGVLMSEFPESKRKGIACKLAPDCVLVQLNFFLKLIQDGRMNEAREIVPKLKRLDAITATGDYAEAVLALEDGKPKAAITVLLKAIAVNPHEADFHVRLADAYARKGSLNDARESLRDALRCPLKPRGREEPQRLIDNTNDLAAWGLCGRGMAMNNKGDWNGALKSFDRAIELRSDYVDAYYGRALAKQSKGDLNCALADYDKIIALSPNAAVVYLIRGSLKTTKGDLEGASSDYAKAVELDPGLDLSLKGRMKVKGAGLEK